MQPHPHDYIPHGLPPRPPAGAPDRYAPPPGYMAQLPGQLMDRLQGTPPGISAATPAGVLGWVRLLWALPGVAVVAIMVTTAIGLWTPTPDANGELAWPDGPTAERWLNAESPFWDERLLSEALGEESDNAPAAESTQPISPELFISPTDTPPPAPAARTAAPDSAMQQLQQGLDNLFENTDDPDALYREAWMEAGSEPLS